MPARIGNSHRPIHETLHCTSFDKIALVGDRTWEKWMAAVCKLFTMAKVRYFDAADVDKAWAWL